MTGQLPRGSVFPKEAARGDAGPIPGCLRGIRRPEVRMEKERSEMIDLSVPRIRFQMKNRMEKTYSEPQLPEGFSFANYRRGMESDWTRIMCSVAFFDAPEKAEKVFREDFLRFPQEAERRVFFILSPEKTPVASCSAWIEGDYRKLHWLALEPEYQGRGLGRAMAEKVLYFFQQAGEKPIYLDTQTSSHRAVCLYLKEGFYPITVWRGKTEPDPQFPQAVQVLGSVMPGDSFRRFCGTARPD